jgi:carboxypeptidase D
MLQYPAYYNFTVSPGNTYDHPLLNDSQAELMFDRIYGAGNCTDQVQNCRKAGDDKTCQLAGTFCDRNLNDLYKASGRNVYDMRELDPDPFPYNFYRTYLNNPEVLAAIGAYVNYSSFNLAVGLGFSNTGDKTRESGIIEDLRSLVNAGVTVALYAGDADYICNWFGVEAVADEVAVRNWGEAGYVNLSTSDCIVHGQSKQAGRFSFTRVYESGHDVPFYQPLAALEMFSRAIKGLDIATGTVEVEPSSGYVTTGTPKSTYREGNATVQYEVLPANSTYDPAKNGPGAPWKA